MTTNRHGLVPRQGHGLNVGDRMLDKLDRQTSRELRQVEGQTVIRVAEVRADAVVQAAKMREIDYLATAAMTGQAMLHRWRDEVSGGDPMLHDALKVFIDIAVMSKADVLQDGIANLRHR